MASSFQIKCKGCKEAVFGENDEGCFVAKNIKALESNLGNGKSFAICEKCKRRNYIDKLVLIK